MKRSYKGLFEDWEVAIAVKLVKKYQRDWPFLKRDGQDDLIQECLIYWIEHKPTYDSTKNASRQTYMAGVLKKHLSHFKERAYADKRKPIYLTDSIDELMDNEDSSPSAKKKIEPAILHDASIGIDLSLALNQLTSDQRLICRLLLEEDLSPNQISQKLSKHHSHIYREIRRIQLLFESAGLREYLKKNLR